MLERKTEGGSLSYLVMTPVATHAFDEIKNQNRGLGEGVSGSRDGHQFLEKEAVASEKPKHQNLTDEGLLIIKNARWLAGRFLITSGVACCLLVG